MFEKVIGLTASWNVEYNRRFSKCKRRFSKGSNFKKLDVKAKM